MELGIIIQTRGLIKEFDGLVAVNRLDMDVHKGEIFGLLGPNGAGKTTTIRMLLDIIKPDKGKIRIFDGPPSERTKERIGYLPEERGLYRNIKLLDCLVYLGMLKGMDRSLASERAMDLLERVGLANQARSKIKEMSKGMQQKAQFVATVVHDPELVILDEPFLGLDPINVELVKEMILEMREEGKTVVLSTHQMNLVEELCNRILLINRGKAVLYGPLADIKARYAKHSVILSCEGPLGEVAGARRVERRGSNYEIFLRDDTSPQDVLLELIERRVPVTHFEVATPPLEEIFIAVVEEKR
jgi:ABC-2 type transport system ATP-binding protein